MGLATFGKLRVVVFGAAVGVTLSVPATGRGVGTAAPEVTTI
jgi:hypothetical protein